jgi:hypothetical protein
MKGSQHYRNFLKAILDCNLDEDDKKFYQWQFDNALDVAITHFDKIGLKVDDYWLYDHIHINRCYDNAKSTFDIHPDIKYIEGFIIIGSMPIQHAWNSYKGKHFDLTSHLHLDNKVHNYVKVIELTLEEHEYLHNKIIHNDLLKTAGYAAIGKLK